MPTKKKLPEELLAQRPSVAEDPSVQHPANGLPIGPPPRLYSRGLHDRILELIEKGNRPEVAAGIAGITRATFYEWMRRGKEGDPHLAELANDVELAEARAEGKAVSTIFEKINAEDPLLKDPEYAKWYLERARAKGWSKQVRTVVENEIEEFLERLKLAFAGEPQIYDQILAVAAGETTASAPPPREEKPSVH